MVVETSEMCLFALTYPANIILRLLKRFYARPSSGRWIFAIAPFGVNIEYDDISRRKPISWRI